jgi:hypothetical protein
MRDEFRRTSVAGGRTIEVAKVRITEAGRRVIAQSAKFVRPHE